MKRQIPQPMEEFEEVNGSFSLRDELELKFLPLAPKITQSSVRMLSRTK
jgi:hypothetical protein